MVAIVFEKIAEAALDFFLRSVGQGAAHQHGRSISDVRVNGFVGQRRLAQMQAHGIHGIGEITLGIDEGAVKIKNQEFFQLSTFLSFSCFSRFFRSSSSHSLRISNMLSRNAFFTALGASLEQMFDASST